MALVPSRREILRAFRSLVERLNLGSGVAVGERDIRVEAIHRLRIGDPDAVEPVHAVSTELSQIHVEGAVFLQHEENVLDHPRAGGADRDRCGLRD